MNVFECGALHSSNYIFLVEEPLTSLCPPPILTKPTPECNKDQINALAEAAFD